VDIYGKLLATIKRRVELCDLPRAMNVGTNRVIATTIVFTMAEAELMHARKRYSSITQLTKCRVFMKKNWCH